ncbi:SagB family peptide dehydrogenase [Nodosilinea sp. LEGE 07088]|uniref:SagB family peptide dehydrogenase n=1 Tax=Nodosilinea sp. LEGE 07088 TaxID=2777968 RepID=UPI00187E3D2C|nr:SagB family peptide dehydrogenase [Nodosilinea sp. LEGE 07088]MBE9140039.1 SagB family peptide dehydrogenase [Nodosilinea sp. LEGE 07088]
MVPSKLRLRTVHGQTNHSYESVKINPNYVDASTQPSAYKAYPLFYRRYPLDKANQTHALIEATSTITLERQYRHYTAQLRVIPSAGGLYPTELYVQIRGVEGIISGLYHYEVAHNQLTLIYELIDDGLEAYICPGYTIEGLIFLVSCVYFRSSWKYEERSLRYGFLDGGHHLGAIEAAAYAFNHSLELVFDFDKTKLNQAMGFAHQEWALGAAIAGNASPHPRREFRLPIPFVCGTDYFIPSGFLEQGYEATLAPASPRQPLQTPAWTYDRPALLDAIYRRRSARYFRQAAISLDDYQAVVSAIAQPIATHSQEVIEIYAVVLRVTGLAPGLYRGEELLQGGDFSAQAAYLCVDQRIAGDGAVTFFLAAHPQNYQTAMQVAGVLGQRLYLASTYAAITCTGIGAYYDEETQAFLGTEKDILYALAIGR